MEVDIYPAYTVDIYATHPHAEPCFVTSLVRGGRPEQAPGQQRRTAESRYPRIKHIGEEKSILTIAQWLQAHLIDISFRSMISARN